MSALDFEQFIHLNSPLHRWHPAHKLVGMAALIIAFALLENLYLIPAMVAVTLSLYALSRLPWSLLAHHLRYPGLFIMGVVVFMPFLMGPTVIWQWGAITLRAEGLSNVLLVISRFFSILTLGVIILATSPFAKTIKAMRTLGLPSVLADMILLSYRYLFELTHMLTTMQQSMRLRGFQRSDHRAWSWQASRAKLQRYAALTGTLLVRSYEQAQRSYQAMSLRGYGQGTGGQTSVGPSQLWGRTALIGMLLLASGFIISDLL